MKKKISDQDKKDWKKFLDSDEKLVNKDINNHNLKKNLKKKSIDLHGYSLENANKTISDFINKCYLEEISSIKVITGKGSRSKNKENPYQSKTLGILKHSVPDYIKSNSDLMKLIKYINEEHINNPNQGSFELYLKKFKE